MKLPKVFNHIRRIQEGFLEKIERKKEQREGKAEKDIWEKKLSGHSCFAKLLKASHCLEHRM